MGSTLPAPSKEIKSNANAGYMPQLDGLRAFAVIAVLFYHFLPDAKLNVWAVGGVKLFFVLSGFLITGILLRSRDLREKRGQNWGFAIRQFYARRFLRIFPLYYFVIGMALLLGLEPVRQILPWLLSYTLNFHMGFQGWYVDHFAHFWTLAVEEQFYIVWPWFILFAPRKWLVPVCTLFVLTGPGYRLYEIVTGFKRLEVYILTPACLDALCMGALLAMANRLTGDAKKVRSVLTRFALPVGLGGIYILNCWFRGAEAWEIKNVLFDFVLALFFTWLVASTSMGFRGPAGWIFSAKPLAYVGKISYGVYVYHPFMPRLTNHIFTQLGLELSPHGWENFVVSAVLTLAIASLSWYLMESPINNLKKHFEYDSAAKSKGQNPS
jgi:peptidoglycan/LPS O-acetylase OafA/YrhL